MCRVRSSPACRTERKRSPEQPGPKGNARRTAIPKKSQVLKLQPDQLAAEAIQFVAQTVRLFSSRGNGELHPRYEADLDRLRMIALRRHLSARQERQVEPPAKKSNTTSSAE